jgi:hypothetical protein
VKDGYRPPIGRLFLGRTVAVGDNFQLINQYVMGRHLVRHHKTRTAGRDFQRNGIGRLGIGRLSAIACRSSATVNEKSSPNTEKFLNPAKDRVN